MIAYDSTGMERVPFDGRTGPPLRSLSPRRPTSPNHGRQCRPSNPEIGCVCGEDERRALRAERRERPSCPKCGESPIDFSEPCPSCWTDWSALIGGAR